eukprot:CAMPEP_0116947058 /NCGR_PEP_ID=MMETSP0467-20121206/37419_1 /TAXON_ID=283647 /ORGANISM="Mesodinium pulex, Strain SPMC105" /LENGTH=91 /DNA_ID=CAMNT_0004631083 /DNA_START=496 /DNA_END=771 /DNA_ORIENTATION=+
MNVRTKSQARKVFQMTHKPAFGIKKYKMDEDVEQKIRELEERKKEMERRDPNILSKKLTDQMDQFYKLDIKQEKKDFLNLVNEHLLDIQAK